MTAQSDRFEKFVRKLYGRAPTGEEGAAALPTTIAETVRALDPRAFFTIAHSTLAMAPFLLTLEESQIPRTSLRYVLVHDEIGPAGFLLLTVVQLDLMGLRRGAAPARGPKAAAPSEPKEAPSFARIIIGGHPLFRGNHFFEFRDPDPTPSLFASMVRAAYRVRKQEGIDVSLLKDIPPEDLPRLAPLEKYGYLRFETQPNTILRIDPRWKTFGGYLSSLSAKSRKAIIEQRRAFESRGLVLEKARPTPIASELAELYAKTRHRSSSRIGMLTPGFFRAVEDHLRDAFRLWVVRRDQRIIAFVCAIHDRISQKGRNRLLGLFLGFDDRLDEECRLHPNLLYRLVEEAIDEGFDILNLGIDSTHLQGELGAEPEPLHCFVLHLPESKSPILQALFEQIIQPSRISSRHASR